MKKVSDFMSRVKGNQTKNTVESQARATVKIFLLHDGRLFWEIPSKIPGVSTAEDMTGAINLMGNAIVAMTMKMAEMQKKEESPIVPAPPGLVVN